MLSHSMIIICLSSPNQPVLAVDLVTLCRQLSDYGGAPLIIVLDDVTSSFDGGHQFHLMEVIRTKFARPGKAGGRQVILLSHDTLLEKLFNKNAG